HLLSRRPELDLDPRRLVLFPALGQPQATFASREERRGHICEAVAHGVERLLEAAVDGLRELNPKSLELGAGSLDVGPLGLELLEPGALAVVLLLREGIHGPDRVPAPLDALELRPQLLGVVALLGLRV